VLIVSYIVTMHVCKALASLASLLKTKTARFQLAEVRGFFLSTYIQAPLVGLPQSPTYSQYFSATTSTMNGVLIIVWLMNPDPGKSLKEIRWCWCTWWCNPQSPSALTQTGGKRKTHHSPVIYLILHFQSDNCLVYFYTFLWWIFHGIFVIFIYLFTILTCWISLFVICIASYITLESSKIASNPIIAKEWDEMEYLTN
jgi:hypothetical protein